MDNEREAVTVSLEEFFREKLLKEEQARDLTPQTNLLEHGVLDSLGLVRLVSFLRSDMGVEVPPRLLTSSTFKTLDDIVAMVLGIRAETRSGPHA